MLDWLIGLGWFSLAVIVLALIGAVSVLRFLFSGHGRRLEHFGDEED
jgi:hypothetical protein